MSRRVCICALVLLGFSLTLVDDVKAWPRLRRRRTSSGGSVSVAAKVDNDPARMRRLSVYFDYDKAKQPEAAFADRIPVYLRVLDENVLNAEVPIVAEVKLVDLSNSETTHVKWCPVSLEANSGGKEDQKDTERAGTFEVVNAEDESVIEPAKVYRLFVNLHRESEEYGDETILGRVPTPYYVATSGESILEQARQQIAMRTFREFYYTERGWNRNADYPMNCVAYYCWATGHCTVGASYGRTNLGRLFRGRNGYRNGGAVRSLSEEGAVHGDYLATSTHVFMLLAYDADYGRAWTMEGNFNNTIEVCLRPVSSSWTLGHLVEEHIDVAAIRPESTLGEPTDAVALDSMPVDAAAIP
jgi:hypothetical protein